jgi:hypothetical protein
MPMRWLGITLCLLWAGHQLTRLINALRQLLQRDPLSRAFDLELQRRGLLRG